VAVKRALEGSGGRERAAVSLRDKEARVVFDPAQVTVEELIAAVNILGFRATRKGADSR
jgi:copper chaperone CopZ